MFLLYIIGYRSTRPPFIPISVYSLWFLSHLWDFLYLNLYSKFSFSYFSVVSIGTTDSSLERLSRVKFRRGSSYRWSRDGRRPSLLSVALFLLHSLLPKMISSPPQKYCTEFESFFYHWENVLNQVLIRLSSPKNIPNDCLLVVRVTLQPKKICIWFSLSFSLFILT